MEKYIKNNIIIEKRLLNIEEAKTYLGMSSVDALYQKVCRRQIPFVRDGKRIKFDKVELDRWIEEHTVRENNLK